MSQTVSFVIFAIGIVICILGGAKVPDEGQTWPSTLGLFIGGLVVAITGLIAWRKAVAATSANEAESKDGQDPATLLSDLVAPLEKLGAEIGDLDTESITARVDEVLDKYVLPFAEVRQRIVNKFGMEQGAEILVVVAYGERMLNRVWSAAADGHHQEACNSFPEASEAFNEAVRLLNQAG
ncbi:MAG: hypothetical protein VYC39_01750 [Myxococcota bacterium]|nr:hypothetical protein [Myxococcota bacterium]